MRKLFRLFTRCSSALLLVFLPITAGWSCGPILIANEARFGLFRHDAEGSPTLEPFYYTESFLNGRTYNAGEKDYQRNCAEWRSITGSGVSIKDIYAIQYTTEPDSFLGAYNTGRWDSLRKNSFVQWLLQPANKKALQYMALAKRAEWTQFGATNPWGEGRLPAANLEALAREAETASWSTTSPFLKTRYAFQAVKMWYYAGYHTNAPDSPRIPRINALYDSVLYGNPSIVGGWAALYHGMVQKDSIEHTRSIVRAFDLTEEKKHFAYQQLEEEDLDNLLREEKDPTLRTAAMAMKGAKRMGPALQELKAVASADPQSKYLALLTGREVAKIEDWLLSPEALHFESGSRYDSFYQSKDYYSSKSKYDTGYSYYAKLNRAKDLAYSAALRSLLQTIAPRSGTHRTYLMLAVAHLFSIEGRFKEAHDILASLPEPAAKSLRIQWLVGLVVAEMHLKDVRQTSTQNLLLKRLSALEELGLHSPFDRFEESSEWTGTDEETDDLSEVLLLLSRRFYETGDIVRAGLLYNKAALTTNHYDGGIWYEPDTSVRYNKIAFFDRHASPENVDELLRFKNRKDASAFDAYISPDRWAPEDFYHDLKGTLIFRQGRYQASLKVFEAMAETFWETTYEYKSYLPRTSITSVGTLLPNGTSPRVYALASKKALLREIVALQDSVAKASVPEIKARLMLKWAHFQYNTSYYGKGWMLFSYGNSSREMGREVYEDDYRWAYYTGEPALRYARKYYHLSDATNAYKEAWRLSGKDKETAAAALLMLMHCDLLTYRLKDGHDLPLGVYRSYWSDEEEKYESSYLRMLRKSFGGTALFQQALTTCPDVTE